MRIYSLLFLIASIVIICSFVIMHESVHKEIFRHYGINAEIDYLSNFPFKAVTTSDKPCPNQECILANNMNDVIGYQLQPFLGLFLVGFSIIIILMENNGK